MQGKRAVLIFGACGFVGSYLAKEFKENGYIVYGSDISDVCTNQFLDGYKKVDLLDACSVTDICMRFKPSMIVNLAAISSVGQSWCVPQKTMQVNVCGTLNILEAAIALKSSPKILLIGSSEEYAPSNKSLKETDFIDGNNPYGISKIAQERFAKIYEQRYGMRIYRTRSFNHTGVGQSLSFVLPSWCKQVAEIEKSGKPGVLKVGNIEVSRDFGDVCDFVRAYRMLVESDFSGEVFNIGTGRAIKLREMAEYIASLSSQEVSIEVDSSLLRPSDNNIICCDRTKAEELLGWAPRYSIEDVLTRLYQNFLGN